MRMPASNGAILLTKIVNIRRGSLSTRQFSPIIFSSSKFFKLKSKQTPNSQPPRVLLKKNFNPV